MSCFGAPACLKASNLLTCAWLATTPFVSSASSAGVCIYRERESSSSRRVRASWTEPALISSQKHDASSHLAVRRGGKAHHFCAIKAGGGVLVVLSSCGAAHSTRTVNPAQRTSYILYWHCGTSAMPVERHLAGALAGIQHLCVVHSFPPWVGWVLRGVAGCQSPRAAPSPCAQAAHCCAPNMCQGFWCVERGQSESRKGGVCGFHAPPSRGWGVVTGHRESKGRATWSRPTTADISASCMASFIFSLLCCSQHSAAPSGHTGQHACRAPLCWCRVLQVSVGLEGGRLPV